MKQEIDALLKNIVEDYTSFASNRLAAKSAKVKEFSDGLCVSEGKKYTKILTNGGNTVWGFVVNVDDDKKFEKGDLLKAASYNAPARNHARGNILKDDYRIAWTGPLYMDTIKQFGA